MSSIEDFNRLECELIPAAMVNAYVEPKLNPLNTSELIIESSWGEEKVNLAPAVKANETVTHLSLSPENAPLYLEYANEANERECIYGEDLAKIIPLMKLKEVDDTVEPTDGDTLVYDGDTDKFVLYPLIATISDLTTRLAAAETTIQNMQTVIAGMQTTINQILAKITPPAGVPTGQIVFGTINLYSDNTNSNLKTDGFFTHNPAEDKENDERFA